MKVSGKLCAADGLSTRVDTPDAVREACEQVAGRIGSNPDVALAFFTMHHAAQAGRVLEDMRGHLGADLVVGVTASGVIGAGQEVQMGPGFSIWSARLPGTRVQAFQLTVERSKKGEGGLVRGWPDAGPDASVVLLCDPYTFPFDPFLTSLRKNPKGLPAILGGLASGGNGPGQNRLLAEDAVHQEGAVGFVIQGPARLQPLVSQGCRPLGKRFHVTRSDRNVIFELDRKPASERLHEVMDSLVPEDLECFRRAPQVGFQAGAEKTDLGSGGFLIRGLVNVDTQSGAVAVSDYVHEGGVVQFYARDHRSATADMDSLLGLASSHTPAAAGALLFSCSGRGVHLFGRTGHDVEKIREFYPSLPVSGFFCSGEIGPVCGLPYVHGFTASMALLVENAG